MRAWMTSTSSSSSSKMHSQYSSNAGWCSPAVGMRSEPTARPIDVLLARSATWPSVRVHCPCTADEPDWSPEGSSCLPPSPSTTSASAAPTGACSTRSISSWRPAGGSAWSARTGSASRPCSPCAPATLATRAGRVRAGAARRRPSAGLRQEPERSAETVAELLARRTGVDRRPASSSTPPPRRWPPTTAGAAERYDRGVAPVAGARRRRLRGARR